MPPTDPFDTATVRDRVLRAWADSAARLREDANAEEDLALGAYRDRVVVELAQNAADAAVRAGVPGRLRLRLHEGVLSAANTGAALDAAGVQALSTLRASAKRDERGTAGRFGVGFAAVLAVSDEPQVRSAGGAVGWSRARAAACLAELAAAAGPAAEVAAEVGRRGAAVPVLRLPWPVGAQPPAPPYDTEVVLPLRDAAAGDLVAALLADVDDALLITLPALREVVVETDGHRRTLTATAATSGEVVVTQRGPGRAEWSTRWRLLHDGGALDPGLLRDRPWEERERATWSVTVAVPVDDAGAPVPLPPGLPAVLHAPTPTEEPLGLAGLVIASAPMGPDRRRTVPGPLRSEVLARAGRAWGRLVAALPPDPRLLRLLPSPVPAGGVDAEVGAGALEELSQRAWLPAVAGDRVRPVEAAMVEGLAGRASDPGALAEVVPGLLDPAWWRPGPLRRLGVSVLPLADVVDALAGTRRSPTQWRRLYAALDGADPEELAALPVPLADGRVVRGARGALLAGAGLSGPGAPDPQVLRALGLRVVDPDAAHPLLERLGAAPASAAAVLDDPAVREAVESAPELPDADALSLGEAVLALVAATGLGVADLPWLGGVPLPADDGAPAAAADLLLPGAALADVADRESTLTLDEAALRRWGPQLLRRVGVLDGFPVHRLSDVALDVADPPDLPDAQAWVVHVLRDAPASAAPPTVPEMAVVGELDLVRADAWPAVLRLLGEEPAARAAVLDAVRAVDVDGRSRRVRSWTAWWLGEHVTLEGRPVSALRVEGADPVVAALWDGAHARTDPELLAALGARRDLAGVLATTGGADDLLDRLVDPRADRLSPGEVAALYAALAAADPDDVTPPQRLRLPDGRVVDAATASVADGPQWLQLPGSHLPASPATAAALADVLDLPLAGDAGAGDLVAGGDEVPVPPAVRRLLPQAAATYREHEELAVAGRPVAWWVDRVGTIHAATADGLARGLAWAAGRWPARHLLAAVLQDPERAAELAAEQAYD